MTTTLGLSFSARSVAKKFVLFALNITILLLGVACSILCLYQLKLMPAHYEEIIANWRESNQTDLPSARTATTSTMQPFTPKILVTDSSDNFMPKPTPKKKTKPRLKTTPTPIKQTIKLTTVIPSTITTRKPKRETLTTKPPQTMSLSSTTIRHTTMENPVAVPPASSNSGVIYINSLDELLKLNSDQKTSRKTDELTTRIPASTSATIEILRRTEPVLAATETTRIFTAGTTTKAISSSALVTTSTTESTTTKALTTNTETTWNLATWSEKSSASANIQESVTATYPITYGETPLESSSPTPTTRSQKSFTAVIATSKDLAVTIKPNTTKKVAMITNATTAEVMKIELNTTTSPVSSISAQDKLNIIVTTEASIIAEPNVSVVGPDSNEAPKESIGSIDILEKFEIFANSLEKRSVFHMRKRSATLQLVPSAENIPPYFREIFELVQTSLYTSTAAGVLIFFSSLIGICGGIFRVNGCLKFNIGALVIVIMGEMATIGFIFFAHDKASNRSKYKNFHEDFKVLCSLAHFCINEMMLIMVGSFLCVSVVLQIGSISLSCHLMDNINQTEMDYGGNGWRKGAALNRADLQMTNGMLPFANPMAMQMAHLAGHNMSNPYSMYGMGFFHQPMYTGPGQRPVINIIS